MTKLIKQQNNEIVRNENACLNEYLLCESLLNNFFKEINYCYDNCIAPQDDNSVFYAPSAGTSGCCKFNINDFTYEHRLDLLNKKRIEKYGLFKPARYYECGYHTEEKGCNLDDCKPVVCIASICKDMDEYIHKTYSLSYKQENIKEHLYYILDGVLREKEIERFKSNLTKMVTAVKEVNKKTRAKN